MGSMGFLRPSQVALQCRRRDGEPVLGEPLGDGTPRIPLASHAVQFRRQHDDGSTFADFGIASSRRFVEKLLQVGHARKRNLRMWFIRHAGMLLVANSPRRWIRHRAG